MGHVRWVTGENGLGARVRSEVCSNPKNLILRPVGVGPLHPRFCACKPGACKLVTSNSEGNHRLSRSCLLDANRLSPASQPMKCIHSKPLPIPQGSLFLSEEWAKGRWLGDTGTDPTPVSVHWGFLGVQGSDHNHIYRSDQSPMWQPSLGNEFTP